MKLLKFVNSDAPHTLEGAQLHNRRLWFPCKQPNISAVSKIWSIDAASSASLSGGYWLLDDNENPICEITDVMLAVPETAMKAAATTTSGSSSSSIFVPHGITDSDINGVDFRSKMGRQMERERATYGSTSKTANKSLRTMINAEEMTEKKHQRMKREREAVAESIDNNLNPAEPGKKEKKRSKK